MGMNWYKKAEIPEGLNEDFNNWFKGSKVVDTNGDPMKVFHGTNQPIVNFDPDRLGFNTKTVSSLDGFFFTENKDEAKEYADHSANRQVANAVEQEKKEEELSRKLEDAENRGDWELSEKIMEEWEETSLGAINSDPIGQRIYSVYLSIKNPFIVQAAGIRNSGEIADILQEAKRLGHDGVQMRGIQDGFAEKKQING